VDLLDKFLKNSQIPNFVKIRQAGAELTRAGGVRTDGRTGTDSHDEANIAFRSFVNTPKVDC